MAKFWLGWRPEIQSLVIVRACGDLSRTGSSEGGFQGLWSVEIFERMHAEHITWDIWEWPWCSSFHEPPCPKEETLGVQLGVSLSRAGVLDAAWPRTSCPSYPFRMLSGSIHPTIPGSVSRVGTDSGSFWCLYHI